MEVAKSGVHTQAASKSIVDILLSIMMALFTKRLESPQLCKLHETPFEPRYPTSNLEQSCLVHNNAICYTERPLPTSFESSLPRRPKIRPNLLGLSGIRIAIVSIHSLFVLLSPFSRTSTRRRSMTRSRITLNKARRERRRSHSGHRRRARCLYRRLLEFESALFPLFLPVDFILPHIL